MIKFIVYFSLVDTPIIIKYNMPKNANTLNLFSLINIVLMSSDEIENKMYESIKVNNNLIDIID
tara:strand:- start:62 stop:253 length:192 start_codon:yes stop_codon:yes gene_type:complete